MSCVYCGKELPKGRRCFCSNSCKNKFYVTENRRKNKSKLIAEHGGKCVRCGYDKCEAALQFHHVDPDSKEFGISDKGVTRSYEKLQEEAQKCILVCANCHAEIEYS